MIKEIPGWANFAGLLIVYFLALTIFDVLFKFDAIFWSQHRLIHCLLFCGAYMAKWRFYDGGWHFNGNLLEILKKLWTKLF